MRAHPRFIRPYKGKILIPVVLPIKDEPVSLLQNFLYNWDSNDSRFLLVIVDDSSSGVSTQYIELLRKIGDIKTINSKDYFVVATKNIIYTKRFGGSKGKGSAINFAVRLLDLLGYKFKAFAIYDIEWKVNYNNLLKGYNYFNQ